MLESKTCIAVYHHNALMLRAYENLFYKNPRFNIQLTDIDIENLCTHPDLDSCEVVVAGIDMKTVGNLQSCRDRIRDRHPGLKLVVDGTFASPDKIREILGLQVRSIVSVEQQRPEELIQTLRNVIRNGSDFTMIERQFPDTKALIERYCSSIPDFTNRHWQIMAALGAGLAKTAIADVLAVDRSTVHRDITQMLELTGCENPAELLIKAAHNGWIAIDPSVSKPT